RAIGEIGADLAREEPMNRLLQGDVGSGKTACALAAAEIAMAAGRQVALMAPTEILAEQHFASLGHALRALGRRHALLTASTPRASRESTLAVAQAGALDLLVGTHALLAERVVFAELGLVIVDEQHRFGVAERARLRAKGRSVPHLLVMTATPIPRTMALTLYGDLDLSVIDELPPGRRPSVTRVLSERERGVAHAALRETVGNGGCAYLVCPLVSESQDLDLRDATSTYEELRRSAPDLRVALVHGRTPTHERDPIVARLRRGEIDVLVTTSLIEVGLDVPHATLLVVEHAERFGLAQLHQLRGRVGRGGQAGICLLLTGAAAGSEARARLDVLVQTADGFRIAEEDLRLRGPGEIYGTRQAGLPRLRFADLGAHGVLLAAAREEAKRLIEEDPGLERHPETRKVLDDRWAEAALYGEEAG
ncbi:MAG: DEAD/DEAH box helicase, partial [Myxococcota bacterium]